MSKRLFYLADGTLQKATAGEFRGDDPEISTQVVTREIVIKAEDGGTGVKLDPDAPSGPLVLHYDSSKNQKGLTIFDDHSNSIAVEVEHTGVVRANNGISVDAGGISGTAFDTGDWALASSSDAAPYENTVVTRDALAEVVRVSNLRVFDKQNDTTDLNYAGDGLPRGLFFDKGYCGGPPHGVPEPRQRPRPAQPGSGPLHRGPPAPARQCVCAGSNRRGNPPGGGGCGKSDLKETCMS